MVSVISRAAAQRGCVQASCTAPHCAGMLAITHLGRVARHEWGWGACRLRARWGAQGHLGAPPDRGAHLSDAELGDGVQEVGACLQAAHLLRHRQRAGRQAQRLDQTQRVPHLHHLLRRHPAGARHPSPFQTLILEPSSTASPPTPSSCKRATSCLAIIAWSSPWQAAKQQPGCSCADHAVRSAAGHPCQGAHGHLCAFRAWAAFR